MKFMFIFETSEPFDASTSSDKVPGASRQKVTKGDKRCVFRDLNHAPYSKLHPKETRYPLGHDRHGGSLGPAKLYPLYTLTPTLSYGHWQ
jgi:hypothetical protein